MNSNLSNGTVSVFHGIKPDPIQSVNWQQVLQNIQSDKYKKYITEGQKIKDPDAYREYKKKLPAVTFAGKFTKRNKNNVISTTGFIIPDLDHLPNVNQVFELLKQDAMVWFLFKSPSGEGLKCAIRAKNIQTDDDIKRLYASVERYFKEVYGLEIDPACKDISRLTFVSYDPDLWINPKPFYFNIEKWKPKENPNPEPVYNFPENRNNGWKEKYGLKVLESCCREIQESQPGNQHHTRLTKARLIGGFIPEFLNESEVLAALEQAVHASGAKQFTQAMKTVRDGIEYGKQSPIQVNPNQHNVSSQSKRENVNDSTHEIKRRVDISNVYTAGQMLQSYRKYMADLENNQFKTGITQVDHKIRGVAGGEVLTIIARAGAYKTAMLQNMLFNYTKRSKYASLFFSIEMPVPSVTERYLQILGKETGRGIEGIYKSNNPHHVKIMEDQFKEDLNRVFVVPIKISLSDIGSYVSIIESEHNVKVGVIGIDYLGLIDGPGQNEYEIVSRIARGAKDAAKLLNLPVIILSQVSRKGGDGEIEISLDMGRGSGAIEEGADFILGLWQEQKDSRDCVPQQNEPIDEYDLICRILKNRKGPKGSRWKLELDPACFRIGSDATPHEPKQNRGKGF